MTASSQLPPTEVLAGAVPHGATGGNLEPGAQLGPYVIRHLLGEGGMGRVYLAAQLQPVRREVALKLVREQVSSPLARAYFEVERQALAQMQHPAIAQVFDAGTTDDGHPYLVMEVVQGRPVTQFCNEEKLDRAQRLALFVRICHGVQHAHQKGIIHRDLKPANVLVRNVDGVPSPKIIDFGIAVSDVQQGAGAVDRAGTAMYMSPEQARSDEHGLDTRSDVYSLGVMLFEVLTGIDAAATISNAHQSTLAPQQTLLTALEEGSDVIDADAASRALQQAARQLPKELRAVLLKALAPDRADRYDSAAALADDLERYRDKRMVKAMPKTRGYLLRCFVVRNRVMVMVAAVVMVALVGGLVVSMYGLQQAREQRGVAEQRSAELKKVVDFQQSMLEGIDIEVMGIGMANGLRTQMAQRPPNEVAALELALSHVSTVDLARNLMDKDILANAEKAIARDFASDPMMAADLRESVAKIKLKLGLMQEAAHGFAQVADYRTKALGATAPQTLRARLEQADALLGAADYKAALALGEETLRNAEHLPAADPMRIKLRLNQADAIAELGDRPRARELLEQLRGEAIEQLGERDPTTMSVTNALAKLLARMGEAQAARDLLEVLVPMYEQISGTDDDDTLIAQGELAVARSLTKDHEGAIALQRRLADTRARRLGAEHPATLLARNNLGTILVEDDQFDEALPIIRDVAKARARVLGPDHPQTLRSILNLSTVLARLHRFDEAIVLQKQVEEARIRLLGPEHPDTLFISINRTATLYQAGQSRAALEKLDHVLPIAQRVLGDRHPQVHAAYAIRADAAEQIGNYALAIVSYQKLLELREEKFGQDADETVKAAESLEEILRKHGNTKAANELRAKYPALVPDKKP
jgi:non-specific serine/threonine protein kinase/serine/threonine-protein kinase